MFDENEHLHQKLKLTDQHDIDILRSLAHDRRMWRRLFYYVVLYISEFGGITLSNFVICN